MPIYIHSFKAKRILHERKQPELEIDQRTQKYLNDHQWTQTKKFNTSYFIKKTLAIECLKFT